MRRRERGHLAGGGGRPLRSPLRAAFSLIELLITMTIVVVLAGAALLFYEGYLEKQNTALAATQLDDLRARVFRRSLIGKTVRPESLAEALGEAPGLDPWGNEYLLVRERGPVDVVPQATEPETASGAEPGDEPATDGVIQSWLVSRGPDGVPSDDDVYRELKLGTVTPPAALPKDPLSDNPALARLLGPRSLAGPVGGGGEDGDDPEVTCQPFSNWDPMLEQHLADPNHGLQHVMFYTAQGFPPFRPLVPKPLWRGKQVLVRVHMWPGTPDPRSQHDFEMEGWRFTVTLNGVVLANRVPDEVDLVFGLFDYGSPARLFITGSTDQPLEQKVLDEDGNLAEVLRGVDQYKASFDMDAWDYCHSPHMIPEMANHKSGTAREWYFVDASGLPPPSKGGKTVEQIYTPEYLAKLHGEPWAPSWVPDARRGRRR